MADITLTDTSPEISKAAGGGGPESAILTDTSPAISKVAGGGGPESAMLTDTAPAIAKAAGGGGREGVLLHDHSPQWWSDPPPVLGARAGLNPLFKGMLDDD